MAAAAVGVIGGKGCVGSSSSSWFHGNKDKNNINSNGRRGGGRIVCAYSVKDHYKTLRLQPGASESDVKQAFRKLALKYHPDVCQGSDCGAEFKRIYKAYDVVMTDLREQEDALEAFNLAKKKVNRGLDEVYRTMGDQEFELWDEWMGWEGAGFCDYASHINPYV